MFPPPPQGAFDIFCIHLIFTKYQQFLVNKLLCRFIGGNHHLKHVQIPMFINFVSKGTFKLEQWMQMIIRLQEHRNYKFPIILFNYSHPMFTTN